MTLRFDDPSGRIVDCTTEDQVHDGEHVRVVTLRFTAEDLRGDPYEATATLFLPGVLDAPAPVWFNCGYQLPDDAALTHVRRGRIVVTPRDPEPGTVFPGANPLCRGPNTELVLAHLVRGLPDADPSAIVYAGGSAGGYAALLVAAEAFPAAVTAPTVPVVDLRFQGEYSFATFPPLAADPPVDNPLIGAVAAALLPIADGWRLAYGDDVTQPAWFAHSPIAHTERLTGPVAAVFSTADFLVPIGQVGLGSTPADGTLLDVLGDAADVRMVPVPPGAQRMETIDLTQQIPEAPLPVPDGARDGRRWLVTVVDEGPPVPGGHWRHALTPDFEPFVARTLAAGIAADQLTRAKLDQLLDRYRGVEWLAPGFRHLDRAAAERADVERGLRVYCAAHARRFSDLYAETDQDRRVLPDDLVRELSSGGE